MKTQKVLAVIAYFFLFGFWWSCSMIISQVLFRGQFNDAAVGTVGMVIMILTAYGLSRYTRNASGRDGDSKSERKTRRRKKKDSEEEEESDDEKDVETKEE